MMPCPMHWRHALKTGLSIGGAVAAPQNSEVRLCQLTHEGGDWVGLCGRSF